MSEWTYVRGSLQLSSSPFEIDPNFNQVEPKREDFETDEAYEEAVDKYRDAYHKAIYLPYPEEQFKLGAPIVGTTPDYTKKKRKNKFGMMVYPDKRCIKFDGTCIYSLPRAKPIIEEAFKLFPQGELGFRYWLDQESCDGRSWMSGFIHPRIYNYYHDAVDKMYSSFPLRWGIHWNFKDLNEYVGVEEDCSYENVSLILCGIHTNLRDTSAEAVKNSLIKFIKYLNEHDISVDNGYLEWYDSYTSYSGYRYAFRTGSWLGEYSIMKLDLKTNEIIWQLNHIHPKEPNSNKTDFKKFVDIEENIRGDNDE